MKKAPGNLRSALALGASEHIAIVGGGGKSTLLFALARELRRQSLKVVTTTTTNVWLWERDQAPWALYLSEEASWENPAGRPVKVPMPHEPVIPDSATAVIAVVGLDALGSACTEKNVFRIDEFRKITGLKSQNRITPEALVKIFAHRKGIFKESPEKARRIVFLNKSDICEDLEEARILAQHIVQLPDAAVDRVVLGSLHNEEYNVILGEER
ncbi:MAG: hypothetical protein B1H13_08365 [Desulfobacteraceae bacterium 4484_190.3]|nr:MAG: hypothetical protein B1H13_08365 [Desulfobacteraceae bacterium 4484_190.3]